ncbi:MAG: chorismate synthase [Vicinamibacteria bacterium]|nr:chorismate synthase [Vicinamibacteria bacterium]
MRVLTAGESHGPAVLCLVEGLPAGLEIAKDRINRELARRQRGYGRGGRMKIERDEVEILSGVRHGLTLGSPVTLVVRNRDHANWADVMSPQVVPEADRTAAISKRERTSPRPGHADLAGALKYMTKDLRNIIERSSARDTAARVAAGMLVQALLDVFGVEVRSHVVRIEGAAVEGDVSFDQMAASALSDVGCIDEAVAGRMRASIDAAKKDGDTVGGEIEMAARGLPPGIGSFAQWTLRLDGLLAQALMSVPSVKAVAAGRGFDAGRLRGSVFHDQIGFAPPRGFTRPSNNAGGIEGGVSNGEEIRVRAVVKPIPTLMKRLPSVDLRTLEPSPAAIERSDTCVVPAAAVVGEAMVRIVLAQALLETYGGDSRDEVLAHFEGTRDLRASTFGFGENPNR